jgi:hypothetical protein
MGIESNFGGPQMNALAEAGQRGSEYVMPCVTQDWRDLLPAPTAVPCAVDKDEGRHNASFVRYEFELR